MYLVPNHPTAEYRQHIGETFMRQAKVASALMQVQKDCLYANRGTSLQELVFKVRTLTGMELSQDYLEEAAQLWFNTNWAVEKAQLHTDHPTLQ